MRRNILRIIKNHSEEVAADELTQLMCYREVRAYYLAYCELPGEISWEEFTAEIEGHFLEEYDGNGELLREVIEKIKKESQNKNT